MAAASESLDAALRAGGRQSGRVEEELPGPWQGRETLTEISADLGSERRKRGNNRIRPQAESLGVKTVCVRWCAAYVTRHRCLPKCAAESPLFSCSHTHTHTLFLAI